MSNRRSFIKNASLLTLGGLVVGGCQGKGAPAGAKDAAKGPKSFGLQIYSLFGELYAGDVATNLKKIGDMGYSYIELAGYGDRKVSGIDMLEFKKMTNDAGLKIVSSHVNPPAREYTKENFDMIADFWKKTAEAHAELGVKYLIQPGQPATRDVEETQYVGEVFNKAGEICNAAGIKFGYHNHSGEFARVVPKGEQQMVEGKEGRRVRNPNTKVVYDIFMENTDPALVLYELDVYWAVMGQNDPVEYMKRYANRIRVLHIKDRAVLGESGMMNFQKIFETAYANGINDFFVELEGVPGESSTKQFDSVKGCADYLINAPFVK